MRRGPIVVVADGDRQSRRQVALPLAGGELGVCRFSDASPWRAYAGAMKRVPTWLTVLPCATPLTWRAIVTSEEGVVVEAEVYSSGSCPGCRRPSAPRHSGMGAR
jgi:hypothetical protein